MQWWHQKCLQIVYGNIGNCKPLFQTWKTGSFMNGSSRMNASPYSGGFNGSDHEYTLSEPVQWLIMLTDYTWAPSHARKTLYKVPQGFSIRGKQFLMNTSQHFGYLYSIKPWIHTFLANCTVISAIGRSMWSTMAVRRALFTSGVQ